eukprot:gnl/TRDRNA2_/TRDRNA2_173494_c2_seq2.p1 gnl/TRDRNA2_/TRDRNA2_173494_c2~~gnl/TRDRNA2_/TRDRNA2_173494_c2_seq2.p1  ORF type:complete len:393 (+),score=41.98 gnl/TRDRNA2_/TRDRNA2_173494_c2_seq2:22-1200(+)
MRSMSIVEILLTPLMLVVSSFQVLSFAFGPRIPWAHEVSQPARLVRHVTMFNVEYSFDIDRSLIFWPKILSVVIAMFFYIVFAVTDMPHVTEHIIRSLQNTGSYKAAVLCAAPCGLLLRLLKTLRMVVYASFQFLSTVLVVPMVKACAEALDCMHPKGEDILCLPGRNCVLTTAKNIRCYEGHHLKLALLLFGLLPVYLVLLIPYAACAGDATYVPLSTLYDFRIWQPDNMWRQAARRKATDLHIGVLHPKPEEAFRTHLVDLCAKVVLPYITTLTTSRPRLQMILVTTVGCIQLIECYFHPPFVEEKFLLVVQSLRLFTVGTMSCGLLTVVLEDPTSYTPMGVLAGITCLILLYVVTMMNSIALRRPGVQVFSTEVRQPTAMDDVELARIQ